MNNSIGTLVLSSSPSPRTFPKQGKAGLALASLVLLLGACGCGADVSSKPQVGAIAFTDANGNPVPAVTAVKAGSGIYFEVVVNNDPAMLGVNWTATCASQLPPGTTLPPGWTVDESCGYFTPPHTLSGPVPSIATSGGGIVAFYQAPAAQPNPATVTLYATSTTDPSRFSSITLSIMP